MFKFTCALTLATLLFSLNCFSQTVAEKKLMDKSMEKIKSSVEYTAKACGAKIEAKLDSASFKGDDALKTANWCSSAVDAIGSLCTDADYKAAVAKQLKSVQCKYDASVKATDSANNYGVTVKKNGSTLDVSYSKDSSNVNSIVGEYLKKNL